MFPSFSLPGPSGHPTIASAPRLRRWCSWAAGLVAGLALSLPAWGAESRRSAPPATAAETQAPQLWTPSDPPNTPMGVGRGIFPGRVTWVRHLAATPWDGKKGHWWEDNTGINQDAVDRMLAASLRALTGAADEADAWTRLFRACNRARGRGDVGYAAGEKVAFKINCNNAYAGYADDDNQIDASPQTVLALVRQLVHRAGIRPEDIYLYEATRVIPDRVFQKTQAEFPAVHFVDSKGDRKNGREPVDWQEQVVGYSVAQPLVGRKVPRCVKEAQYLVNLALLKGHPTTGVTLTAKNHYGTVELRDHKVYANAWAHPMPSYHPFVDMIGSKELGGKTVLYLIDGLFGVRDVNDLVNEHAHWNQLFRGEWLASLFLSQDPIAIDSVGLDFLRAEFPWGRGGKVQPMTNADNYLHEAALADRPPSGTAYAPDGVRLASLGVHEHWNNPTDKNYARNLGRAEGIELYRVALEPKPAADDGWSEMATILRRIVPPQFPARDFPITDFGAVGDGQKDCHAAFAQAIAACHQAGGGRVVVPRGLYRCDGPIHLASNVNLHVSAGATIKFGIEPDRYLPPVLTRYEGTLLYGHSPRIYARGATNIAITGKGTIDGSGRATLDLPKAKQSGGPGSPRSLADKGVPIEQRVYGPGHWLRPSMIQPFECTNVLIEDITVLDSTFWCIHPVFCRNVTVRGVTVDSMNGNNDGCDPDSCVDVLIENCQFHTGDDAIAIKSGRDLDGRQIGRPTENVVIRRIAMGSRHSGLCIGSEMSGGVRNVFMEDCTADRVSSALYFKGNLDRGGFVEHVRVRRVQAKRVRDGLVRFDTTYRAQDLRGGNFAPLFRDYVIEDISAEEAENFGLSIEGLPDHPIREVTLRRAKVGQAKVPYRITRTANVRFEDVVINGQALPATVPDAAVAPERPPGSSAERPGGKK